MNAGLFAVLVLSTSGLIWVLARLFLPRLPWELEEAPERFRVLTRAYERMLRALKDLEHDHQIGGLTDAEHTRLKAEYKEKAVRIRRTLERSRLAALRRISEGKSAAVPHAELARIEALVTRARASAKR